MATTRRSRGLTLLEVLVTTVVMGLVAAALLRAVGGDDRDRVALRALVDEVKSLDARARLLARAGEPAVLSGDASGTRLVVHVRGELAPVAERVLPEEARCTLRCDGLSRASAIAFDPSGASVDYRVEFEHGGARAVVEVAGLTGWTSVREATP